MRSSNVAGESTAALIPAPVLGTMFFHHQGDAMSRRLAQWTAILTAGMGLAACSTIQTAEVRGGEQMKTRDLLPIPASRAQEGTGAALLAFELRGINESDLERSCRWRVINKETGKSHFIPVQLDENHGLAQLEPGDYEAGRFGCGVGRVWELGETFPHGFRVEAGKLSYLGKLIFEFDSMELDTIRHAPRTESALGFTDALEKEDVARWPAMSGFTGKTIDRAMVQNSETRDGFDVFARGIANPNQALAPLLSDLSDCAKAEGKNDPLRFGRLEYTALYKDGRFSEMKDRIEANGFSDRLRSCVERGIMAFHPEKKSDVEVRVRY